MKAIVESLTELETHVGKLPRDSELFKALMSNLFF